MFKCLLNFNAYVVICHLKQKFFISLSNLLLNAPLEGAIRLLCAAEIAVIYSFMDHLLECVLFTSICTEYKPLIFMIIFIIYAKGNQRKSLHLLVDKIKFKYLFEVKPGQNEVELFLKES